MSFAREMIERMLRRQPAPAPAASTPAPRPAVPAPAFTPEPSSFDRALTFTLRHEGGFSNDADDPGGRTNFGIAEHANPEAWADGVVTPEEARAIYRAKYWAPIHGDELPPRTAMVAFDLAVHSGVGAAAKRLQGAVGVAQDGVIGPATLAAVRRAAATPEGDRALALGLVDRRITLLTIWLKAAPGRVKFAGGFMRRIANLAVAVATY